MMDEEETVEPFLARVRAALEGVTFEVILVDDGSTDGTSAAMAAAAAEDPRVKIVALSRNFGHQPALTAGLEHARGDVVVMLDGDLQDPPEVIPQMLERWREGVDVVYAVRQQRLGETAFKRVTARGFYRVFRRLTRMDLAVESGDFRLMDRRALNALLAMPERNRFLRGMTVWIGFTQTAVPFVREERTRRRDQVPAAQDAALLLRRDHVVLERAAAMGDVPRLPVLAARVHRHPADDRRPLHERVRARRPLDDPDHPAPGRDPADHGRASSASTSAASTTRSSTGRCTWSASGSTSTSRTKQS